MHARTYMCVHTRRGKRDTCAYKSDGEKCACGANGGECSARNSRAEPAAECSSEPNSKAASSSLGYCAQKTRMKEHGRVREEGGEEERRRAGERAPAERESR